MSIQTADTIRKDWGKFLEITNGNLMMIFFTKIPQSLLPYPKQSIKEALDIVSKHFSSIGNQDAVNTIESTLPLLEMYVDDEEAIKSAAKKFSDEKYLNAVLPKLSERQKQLFSELVAKHS